MSNESFPRFMDSALAAKYLGVSVKDLRRMVARGTGPCLLPSSRLRFDRKALDAFKARLPAGTL